MGRQGPEYDMHGGEGTEESDEGGDRPDSGLRTRARDLVTTTDLTGSMRVIQDLHRAADLMASGLLPRQAANALVRDHGFSRRSANRYVAAALGMHMRDGAAEPLESKRARILAMAQKGHAMAINREKAVVVMVEQYRQEVEYVSDPDLKAAATYLGIIAKVEGVG